LKEVIISNGIRFEYSTWIGNQQPTDKTKENMKNFQTKKQRFEGIYRNAFRLADGTPINQDAINAELQRRVQETLENTRDIKADGIISEREIKILEDIKKKFKKDMNRMRSGNPPTW
jgi:hypothetical protein